MSEEEYINLQTLLAKFRIVAMKEYGAPDTIQKTREVDLRIIRNIDYLRNHMIVNLDGGKNK